MTYERALEIREFINKFSISRETDRSGKPTGRIQVANVEAVKADPAAPERIRELKPEIMEFFSAAYHPEIEGLAEIRKAEAELSAWHRKFERSFEGENAVGGMGVGPKPQHDIKAMLDEYPRAAAYLKAERNASKSNIELSEIGRKAELEIIFGDYREAMEHMEAAEKAFTERHIWD